MRVRVRVGDMAQVWKSEDTPWNMGSLVLGIELMSSGLAASTFTCCSLAGLVLIFLKGVEPAVL